MWDFGDGQTSTEINPLHVFLKAGTYSVNLSLHGQDRDNSDTKSNYIIVTEPPPQADFSESTTKGIAPLTVTFQNTTTGPYSILLWNLGNGTLTSGESVTTTYLTPGVNTVTLRAFGPGGKDRTIKHIYVFHPGADVDGDHTISLTDAIIIQKWLTKQHVAATTIVPDINGDNVAGIEEISYILKSLALP